MMNVILASGSPRRRELLAYLYENFDVVPARGEEVITSDLPSEVVCQLSEQKAAEVYDRTLEHTRKTMGDAAELALEMSETLVIGSDTVVAFQGKILGKPGDEDRAFEMLSALQGKTHEVYTGVTFIYRKGTEPEEKVTFFERTEVDFVPMTEEEIRTYIATGEPLDKAGAYGIQGYGSRNISGIRGDYYTVMGFPVARLYQELKKAGVPTQED